jgi:hypothetical protein
MKRFQFTIKDLLVLTVVVALLMALLMPYINAARERSRRMQCVNNMKELGVALLNYNNQMKKFPRSADIINNNGQKTVGGWNFLARILPQLGRISLYESLPVKKYPPPDPLTSTDPAIVAAKETPLFLCPSNPNRLYNVAPSGRKEYFTNYKAMGATMASSLKQCVDPDEPPPYGDKTRHPDGAFVPGRCARMAELLIDGTSNTIMMAETMDDQHSVWLYGADATLVGIPDISIVQPLGPPLYASYWAPKGYNGKFADEASTEVKSLRTFLAYDFRPGGKDEGTYPASVGRTPKYGPSSAHPGVVNHLFGDGTVRGLCNDIDCASYFFAISRAGNDSCTPIIDY